MIGPHASPEARDGLWVQPLGKWQRHVHGSIHMWVLHRHAPPSSSVPKHAHPTCMLLLPNTAMVDDHGHTFQGHPHVDCVPLAAIWMECLQAGHTWRNQSTSAPIHSRLSPHHTRPQHASQRHATTACTTKPAGGVWRGVSAERCERDWSTHVVAPHSASPS